MWTALIIAGVMGLAGLADSLYEDDKAKKQAQKEKAYIEEMYALEKAEAEEKFKQAKEEANRSADRADLQADMTDKSMDINEQGLSNDINSAIDNMYLGQQSDTMEWNSAAMNMGASEGNALAGLAASGVRAGSSLNDAVLMESAANEAQLQFAQDAKRRSDNNNLESVLNGIAGQRYGIYQNRVGADQTREDAAYLRNSFNEGGYNWNLYQNQLQQMEKQKDMNVWQKQQEIKYHTGWNAAANAGIAFFTGGAKGYQTGYDLYSTYNKAKAYK